MGLPLYQCHKQVRACKIERVHHAVDEDLAEVRCWLTPENPEIMPIAVGKDYYQKHQPKAGGYYLLYADGYESFSPAGAFEAGYSLIPDDDEDDTQILNPS